MLVLISSRLLALGNTSTEDAEGQVPVWARALAATDRSIQRCCTSKHSNSPRGRNPNQSCAMVSKRDPGIHGSGDYPRREIPETYTEYRRCGAWDIALPQLHGTWSTAYAYGVPTACWYTLAPQLLEMWSMGDPGSRDPEIVMSGIMTRETSRG